MDSGQASNLNSGRSAGFEVGRLLLLASRVYSERALSLMRARGHVGLGMTHALLMAHLDPEGTRLSTLGARAGITKQAAGQTVRDLETLGYVTRISDPSDGRASLITATDRGRAFVADTAAIRAEVAADFVATLGDAPLADLVRLLSIIVAAPPFAGEDE